MYRSTNSDPPGGCRVDSPDFVAIANHPAFLALLARRRRGQLGGWLLAMAGYVALAIAAVLVPDALARPLLGNATVGLCAALAEGVLVLLVAGVYVRRAGRDFDRETECCLLQLDPAVAPDSARDRRGGDR